MEELWGAGGKKEEEGWGTSSGKEEEYWDTDSKVSSPTFNATWPSSRMVEGQAAFLIFVQGQSGGP